MAAFSVRSPLFAASVLLTLLTGAGAPDAGRQAPPSGTPSGVWTWPVSPAVLLRPFELSAGPYGPGHRGVDLESEPEASVRAPAQGMVVFAGWVVDRPVISLDHGGGVVSSLEPVVSVVPVGGTVSAGSLIGSIAPGGHGAPGVIHFGVRVHGAYVDPLSLLSAPARAVLLPCC